MNLINLENVLKAYGPKPLLDAVSLGVESGMRIGIVGRNGGGKSTLMGVLAKRVEPDGGRVTHTGGLRLSYLDQQDDFPDGATIRQIVLGDRVEHDWAGDQQVRDILANLLAGHDLDSTLEGKSGGERRRVSLAKLLAAESDVIMLDEPTNHLDLEAITWLARHLAARKEAQVVVTHDRWFLDEVTDRTWEVVSGRVERYEGGYSAFVLAKAERTRVADSTEAKRQNLMRKELAWLRRGPPARTSKPKFRIDAATALIADVPPLRDKVELTRFATARLGKTVYDVEDVTYHAGPKPIFEHLTWRLGPGDRIGLVGVNGSGKTTLLKLLAGVLQPEKGKVVTGKTVKLAHLSQELVELDPGRRVLESVEEIARRITVGKKDWTAGQLLERLGFGADAQWTPIGDLSGGERRRLQLLRLLMAEPNVMMLDEPTNDLDIETLTEVEDILDGWPGTLIVVSHDRYFLERVTDNVFALLGDGRVRMLTGGVDEYLDRVAAGSAGAARNAETVAVESKQPAKQDWKAKKELDRLERQLDKLTKREARLHADMADAATDHARLLELDAELKSVLNEKDEVEMAWLELAES